MLLAQVRWLIVHIELFDCRVSLCDCIAGSHDPFLLCRKVVEYGLYMKHCKVEVYLMDFKLCQQSQLNETISRQFSRATTVGECVYVCVCVFVCVCVCVNGDIAYLRISEWHCINSVNVQLLKLLSNII